MSPNQTPEAILNAAVDALDGCDLVIQANGSSMIPTIVRGDRVHVSRDARDLSVGRIAYCEDRDGRRFIHRIVRVDPVVTRGDAAEREDPPVTHVLGLVTRIEPTLRSRLRRLTLHVSRLWAQDRKETP